MANPHNPLQQPNPAPQAAPQQAQSQLSSAVAPLMQQAQGALNNPMGQAVPQAGGLDSITQHPLVQAIIQGIAKAAQGYGWTAMQPQEREERTALNQQKATALGGLAGTEAYRGGELENRANAVGVQQQNADTNSSKLDLATSKQQFEQGIQQSRLSLQQDANQWHQDIAQGRLSQGADRITNQMAQFEQRLQQVKDLQTRGLDIKQYQADIQGQMLPIRQGLLELGQTALAQKGTVEGIQAQTKLQQFMVEHPIASSIFGLDSFGQMAGQAQQTPVPGVPQSTGAATASPAPAPTAAPSSPKAAAKAKSKGGGQPTGGFFEQFGGKTHQ